MHAHRMPARYVVLVWTAVALLASSATKPVVAEETLDDALKHALAEIVVCGVGASSGAALIMGIRSLTQGRLQINVRSGTVLRSNDTEAQSMIIHRVEGEYDELVHDLQEKCEEAARREAERANRGEGLSDHWLETKTVDIEPYQSRLYLLSAYCLEFEKDNPSPNTNFTVIGQPNYETARVFDHLQRNPSSYSVAAIQLAIWATNGNHSDAEIGEKFSFDSDDRTSACRLLQAAGINAGQKALCTR